MHELDILVCTSICCSVEVLIESLVLPPLCFFVSKTVFKDSCLVCACDLETAEFIKTNRQESAYSTQLVNSSLIISSLDIRLHNIKATCSP